MRNARPRHFDPQTLHFASRHPFFRSLREGLPTRALVRRLVQAFDHVLAGLPVIAGYAAEQARHPALCRLLGAMQTEARQRHRRYRRFMVEQRIQPLEREPRPMAEAWQDHLFDQLDAVAGDHDVRGLIAAEACLLGPCLDAMGGAVGAHLGGDAPACFAPSSVAPAMRAAVLRSMIAK